MNIPFNEFEHIIDETILKRGLSYFKNGFVSEFSEVSIGEFESNVSGTEEYTVNLKVENDVIVEYNCDCPYDMGPVCKHIAASIFYLKQDHLNLNQQNRPLTKKKKRKTVFQELKDVLDKVSHQDLKKFIQEQSNIDKQFRNLFLSNFAHLNESQSKEFYQKQIKSVVNSATDRHGFIGWHEMKYLEQGIYPIVAIAEKQLESNNYLSVIYICTALMEEMIEAIQFSDDSNGSIGGILDSSYEMLFDIATKDISDDIKTELFNYCITAFKQRLFDGWDWHIGILNIAYKLTDNEAEADIILKCLDTVNEEYEKKRAQLFKLDIISKYKDGKEVQRFIDKHITNSSIRNSEIEKAVNNKDFEKAIRLCKDGVEYDKKDKPGLVKNWYNWLLKIAQAQNNKTKIIEYSRFLFIDNFYPEQDYYQLLKQEIEPNKWKDFLEDIIKEITPKGGWKYNGLVREIYINEKWWDRLFLLLKENTSLENIESNENYLSKDYSQELIELYSERLIKYVDRFIGRNHYQTACRYLRRMKKLGGNEKANELIEYFKKTYPKRKALLDELSRV
ncbi:SWIM zinc finger family protein [Leeuwenhoekiella marinoflava]|uniref:SWIM zinc finger family protein n=1 Tax=Leeuwenhoekiella marinoflava TaxID=988 RepID=UPI0030031C48